MARRPSQPSDKDSIAKKIERLSFLQNVDTMLLEGVSAPDVAKYIQEEMGSLTDLDPKALANALGARRRQREETMRSYRADPEAEGDDGDGDGSVAAEVEEPAARPSILVRELYKRAKGGIKDLLELEAMYLTQRGRVDRMVKLEIERGIFAKDVGQEIMYAGQLILMRTKTKHDLGIDDETDTPQLDVARFSKGTAEVLANPESRHRVLALLQRLAKLGKLKEEGEEQIVLPLPSKPKE